MIVHTFDTFSALAESLVDWYITSNQARTYSPQTMLAVAISDNASRIAGAIRADLSEEDLKRAIPIVEQIDGVSVFTSLTAQGYVRDAKGSADAIDQAKDKLIELMSAYNYEQ